MSQEMSKPSGISLSVGSFFGLIFLCAFAFFVSLFFVSSQTFDDLRVPPETLFGGTLPEGVTPVRTFQHGQLTFGEFLFNEQDLSVRLAMHTGRNMSSPLDSKQFVDAVRLYRTKEVLPKGVSSKLVAYTSGEVDTRRAKNRAGKAIAITDQSSILIEQFSGKDDQFFSLALLSSSTQQLATIASRRKGHPTDDELTAVFRAIPRVKNTLEIMSSNSNKGK